MRSGLGYGISVDRKADAVLTAVTDALYGALGRNEDEKDITKAVSAIEKDFYFIGNVDIVIVTENEKLIPDLDETEKVLTELLHIEETQVNIKVTAVPFPGMLTGDAAYAVQAVAALDTIDNFSYEIDPEAFGGEASGGCGGSKCATCGGCMRAQIEV